MVVTHIQSFFNYRGDLIQYFKDFNYKLTMSYEDSYYNMYEKVFDFVKEYQAK